jgi:hypothetical protein
VGAGVADDVEWFAVWVVGGDDAGVVVEVDAPAAFVDEDVVASTEEDQVAEAGVSTVDPVFQVMGVAPGGRAVAAGEAASAVADVQRPADGRG